MPYGTRRLVAVNLVSIPGVKYGFRTDVADTTSTALGHLDAIDGSGNYIAGLALGINSPKPAKARKYFGTATKKYESSFVDPAKVDSARADGWAIIPGKTGRARSTSHSKLVYVDHKLADAVSTATNAPPQAAITVKYAWRMPLYQYNKLLDSDKTMLGLEDGNPNDVKTYLLGLNNPKPRRASKTISTANGLQTITTFVAWNKSDNLSNGWA